MQNESPEGSTPVTKYYSYALFTRSDNLYTRDNMSSRHTTFCRLTTWLANGQFRQSLYPFSPTVQL